MVRDTNSETCLDESRGNEERGHPQPAPGAAEAGSRFRDRQGRREHRKGRRYERHGPHGNRAKNDPHHGGHEDGQEMPRAGLYTRWNWQEPDGGTDENNRG